MKEFKLANGWTKEKVMEQIKKYNNGRRCVDTNGLCLYQSPEKDNRCAIGAFIPDGHVALSAILPVARLLTKRLELISFMPFEDLQALTAFQQAHDTASRKEGVYGPIQRFLDENVE